MDSGKFDIVLLKMKRLCSVREYCTGDISAKAIKSGLSDIEVARLIDLLKKDKFVDDLRYSEAFARDKIKLSGWGPSKVVYALKTKGVASEIISEAVKGVDPEIQRGVLKRVLEQKLKTLNRDSDPDSVFNKLIRFALQRGYGFGEVFEAVKELTGKNKKSI